VLSVKLPTAVQAADVHETPLSPLAVASVGFEVVWMDQLVPFQRSASVRWVPVLAVKLPTAVQAVADVHETPLSPLAVAPAGFGVFSIDQVVPFQRSASVRWVPVLSV
jgi:hypothetical protein